MTIGEAIYAHLADHAGLAALVGTKIYPGDIPQGVTPPVVVVQLISNPPIPAGGSSYALHGPRYQFSCWADGYKGAVDVCEQVKNALMDYSGVMGGTSGVTVQWCMCENEYDLYDEELRRSGRAIDFIIWHE